MPLRSPLVGPTSQLNDAWDDAATITNPATDAIMVDTGQLPPGRYYLQLWMRASVDADYELEHRNAANSANVHAFNFPISADVVEDHIIAIWITLVQNERIRIRNVSGFTGTGRASIQRGRIA